MKWPFWNRTKDIPQRPAPSVLEPTGDPKRPPSHEVPILSHAVLQEQLRRVATLIGSAHQILLLIEQGGVLEQDLRGLREGLGTAGVEAQQLITRFARRAP